MSGPGDKFLQKEPIVFANGKAMRKLTVEEYEIRVGVRCDRCKKKTEQCECK